MQSIREIFINSLRQNTPKNVSLIEEVAMVLNINYDAAYRRINGKTTISIEEAILLAKHFNISLNNLFEVGDRNLLMVFKTKCINNEKDLLNYFSSTYKSLAKLKKDKTAEFFYNARDLPLFYFLGDHILCKFKIYIWLSFLDNNFSQKQLKFEDYSTSLALMKVIQKIESIYKNSNTTEIWSETVIDSTLKQLNYFYESELLSGKVALQICKQLEQILNRIEMAAYNGKKNNSSKDINFSLYSNELTIFNNNLLIKSKKRKILFTPYSILRYYKIKDHEMCNNMEDYFLKQLQDSILLSTSGKKERYLFFKKLYGKIDKLKKILQQKKEKTHSL